MNNLSTTRGVDFLQARFQVIKSIRKAIKKHEDSITRNRNATSKFSVSCDQNYSTSLLAVPALCCILLIISIAFQPSPHFIAGHLVALIVIIAVVVLNTHLYNLVSNSESGEVKRELEKILYDYEKFSAQCINTLNEGTVIISLYTLLLCFWLPPKTSPNRCRSGINTIF